MRLYDVGQELSTSKHFIDNMNATEHSENVRFYPRNLQVLVPVFMSAITSWFLVFLEKLLISFITPSGEPSPIIAFINNLPRGEEFFDLYLLCFNFVYRLNRVVYN